MQRKHIIKILEPLVLRPSARNNRLRMLRMILNHSIDIGWRETNPAANVKKLQGSTDGFHTWTESEIERFFEVFRPGTLAHDTVSLMLFTGAARSDVVCLGWQNIHETRLKYRRKKTAKQGGAVIDIQIHPELSRVISGLPRDRLTFLETSTGKSRSPNGLGNLMRKWCDQAGLGLCTSHGLRKACATRLAEAGASEREIMAWTGHKSPQMVETYAGKARRGLMADSAFEKMTGNKTGSKVDEPKEKVRQNDNK